jgi:protease-4
MTTEPSNSPAPPTVIVRTVRKGSWVAMLLAVLLCGSVLFNLILMSVTASSLTSATSETSTLQEKFVSGDKTAANRIAVVRITGTIMPPFTERTLKILKRIGDDANIKGVVLAVESPGGFVADSQRIYDRLKELHEKKGKTIYVSMGRLAASGGYYVAMGAGPKAKIFAEPSTWTGSIGVIIPRYDVSQLAENVGVKSEPLVTGPFKDGLNPFKALSPEEREVWKKIMDESFDEFLTIIDDSREKLDMDAVRKLATGQIYTAKQALANGMVDGIKYEDDVIAELEKDLGLTNSRVVTYEYPPSLVDILIGSNAKVPENPLAKMFEAGVPQAMYFFGTPKLAQ